MSADENIQADGPDMLAAEYALGVLDGDELAEAQRRLGSDPAFTADVAAWNERLSPFLAGVAPVEPGGHVWTGIATAIGAEGEPGGNVVALKRRLRVWRGYSAAVTAIAAALALVVALDVTKDQPIAPSQPVQPVGAETLVATLSSEDNPARLVVSWDPDSRSFIVTPAVLNQAAGRDHELWLIPPSGTPRSLGLVQSDASQRIVIPVELLRDLSEDASIALSVEPSGGSPTGLPTGPVIAAGQLHQI